MGFSDAEHRKKNSFGSSWKLTQATAASAGDAVHNRRRDGTDGNLADALGAERPIRLRVFDQKRMNFWRHVECRRYLVIHQAGIGDFRPIPYNFFAEGETEPLDKTALDLSFHRPRIDRLADVTG